MDRQTLRDGMIRFNRAGVAGLSKHKSTGRPSKLTAEQKVMLSQVVNQGPDPVKDGVVRRRCVDLKRVLEELFSVSLSEVSIGRALRQLGLSHISARPLQRNRRGSRNLSARTVNCGRRTIS
jgi:transposase